LKLYNTLSQEIEDFSPADEEVSLYVCGITPYDTTHLGHAFTYASADALVRFLEYRGHKVRYVQNVTDIDDDIVRKAKELGQNVEEVVNQWTSHFIHDMIMLNVRPPDYFPRASDVIPEIIDWVQDLIEAGVGYESGGSVYFDTNDYPEFGKLCSLPREEMLPIANERGNVPDDPNKRDPLDFVLWQAEKSGEPSWESPWGSGRPGWHIECSTLAGRYLGQTVDVHMGGTDLIFPHHESEIAQVEPLQEGKPFVRFWAHVAMVRYKGEKMSKSLGNLVMVRDLLERFSPDAIRLYLASHHYRQVWSYNEDHLISAQKFSDRLKAAMESKNGSGAKVVYEDLEARFVEAMNNDLDSPFAIEAIGALGERLLAGGDGEEARQAMRRMSSIFGLRLDRHNPDRRVADGWMEHLKRFQTP
jgi:L-cysteine:1D-myo-inositol 2-amino-2-deoxy-alpha-D-glucopyranoside ligase